MTTGTPSPPPVSALKRPGGARPLPARAGASAPTKLSIPEGNVPGIHVDQANEGGWQAPNLNLPSLALNPMRSQSSTPRPKLSLSTGPSPAASPALRPLNLDSGTGAGAGAASAAPVPSRPLDLLATHGPHGHASAPALRPALLNAPSAGYPTSRSATPSLKLAIPGLGGAGSNFSGVGNQYPSESDPDKTCMGAPSRRDELEQELRTPTQGSGGFGSAGHTETATGYGGYGGYGSYGGYGNDNERDVTLLARGRDDGDGESSYGYGRIGGGLNNGGAGDMSSMTAEVRQALTRSRFDAGTPSGRSQNQNRSRASSSASSATGGSRSRPTSSRGGPPSAFGGGAHGYPDLGMDKLSLHDAGTPRSSGEHQRDVEVPYSPTIDPDKLVVIKRLGEGSGGAVELVKDSRTGRIMAKKVIARTANPSMHRQLLRELEFLNSCDSPYIVEHYGSFLADHDTLIGILMEYCEGGSLDGLLGKMKLHGMRCSEHVLGRIASSVLRGLDYLHERRIIHRDIKPSNILLTKSGVCKLCDFGVSGELVDSIAGTFTGTSYYMAPERIEGKEYNINADVWSLGLTLHEIAHLRFPYPPEGESTSLTPIELVHLIVRGDVPVMKDDESVVWSQNIKDFMGFCLIRDGTLRPYPRDLLQHPFIKQSEAKNVNMAKWVAAILTLD